MSEPALDVRHLPYMPLQIERLRKSKAWLRCKRRPELAFYIINLWMRAWHEFPAGSIENDDDVLADAAMCSPEAWALVKQDIMHGWELVGDRYFHSTVTELAIDAAGKIKANQVRTEAARRAREEKRVADKSPDPLPSVTTSVTETVTSHEGKGREGKEEEKEATEPSLPVVGGTTSAPPATERNSRGSYLPQDWRPSEGDWRSAVDRLGQPQATRELTRFRNYWFAKSGADGRKRDWDATWNNWVLKAEDDGNGKRGSGGRGPFARAGQFGETGAVAMRSAVDRVVAGCSDDRAGWQPDLGTRAEDPSILDADWTAAGSPRRSLFAA